MADDRRGSQHVRTDGGDAADTPRDEPATRTVAEEHTPSPMRRTIARRLHESYSEAVHVTATRVVDAEALFEAVDVAGDRHGVDLSLSDAVLAAVSATLDRHPSFNATFEDGTRRVYEEHNLGYGVDLEQGLVAPVLADVGPLSIAEIHRRRTALVDRVRAGDYDTADLRGGTFTVSNLGPLGVDSFTPIINPPQVAILGVNAVRERAVRPDDDGGAVAFRRHLPLDLSFDHRVVDGADAGRFLRTLATVIEEPDELFEG
ncbi:2-oxo acid dehydrogenase subunit E2 [Halobaculum magnesiiphilum]|uniref:2-oxo acid dehydrogenase subunit E2 n=1 Tax=Halobaculum magnesiiphilum TaxID=1017351 RepID=A0A8T8WIR7_9EURY|nr:2-oxo acid dehydrogenase subunit E2 [Halobaculum magnesiiphilum]QZP39728.1 2-oxo acid dehydrogenase subunit E2 [Halobaculum magnesiiphilum]